MKNWIPESIKIGAIVTRKITAPISIWNVKHVYKIGWNLNRDKTSDGQCRYALVAITDGMVVPEKSASELCDHFNKYDYDYVTPDQYDEFCALVRSQSSVIPATPKFDYEYQFTTTSGQIYVVVMDQPITDGYSYNKALTELNRQKKDADDIATAFTLTRKSAVDEGD